MTDILTDTAGRVLQVLKKPGDRVEEGETVVLIEAMKMEIPICAEAAGMVETVAVTADQMVEEDDVMATLHPDA